MDLIGVVGASGQLGSSLIQEFAGIAIPISRSTLDVKNINSIVWAAGSVGNRCTEAEAKDELNGVRQMLKKIDFSSIKRILLLSSGGSIYGHSIPYPVTETHVINPETPYAQLKYQVELDFRELCSHKNIPLVILRLANVFSSNGKGIVPTLLRKIDENQPIELLTNLNSRKQYGHCSDYGKVIYRYVREVPLDAMPQVFNVYSPTSYSLKDILEVAGSLRQITFHYLSEEAASTIDSIELSTYFPDIIMSHDWISLESFLRLELKGKE